MTLLRMACSPRTRTPWRRATRPTLTDVVGRLVVVGDFNHHFDHDERMLLVAQAFQLVTLVFNALDAEVPDGGVAPKGREWATDDPTNTIALAPLATRVYLAEVARDKFPDLTPTCTPGADDCDVDCAALKKLRASTDARFRARRLTDDELVAAYPFGAN